MIDQGRLPKDSVLPYTSYVCTIRISSYARINDIFAQCNQFPSLQSLSLEAPDSRVKKGIHEQSNTIIISRTDVSLPVHVTSLTLRDVIIRFHLPYITTVQFSFITAEQLDAMAIYLSNVKRLYLSHLNAAPNYQLPFKNLSFISYSKQCPCLLYTSPSPRD